MERVGLVGLGPRGRTEGSLARWFNFDKEKRWVKRNLRKKERTQK